MALVSGIVVGTLLLIAIECAIGSVNVVSSGQAGQAAGISSSVQVLHASGICQVNDSWNVKIYGFGDQTLAGHYLIETGSAGRLTLVKTPASADLVDKCGRQKPDGIFPKLSYRRPGNADAYTCDYKFQDGTELEIYSDGEGKLRDGSYNLTRVDIKLIIIVEKKKATAGANNNNNTNGAATTTKTREFLLVKRAAKGNATTNPLSGHWLLELDAQDRCKYTLVLKERLQKMDAEQNMVIRLSAVNIQKAAVTVDTEFQIAAMVSKSSKF